MRASPLKRLAGTGLAALIAGTAPTLAVGEAASARTAAPQLAQATTGAQSDSGAGYLSLAEVEARLKADGYTDIREIEHKGAAYEVKARNPAGVPSELYLDARTGVVLSSEIDD
jgi:uncharacterized membrane protein YkoI